MSDDLIQRLRIIGQMHPLATGETATEAADALTAAQEENERLVHDIERLSASLSAEITENERLREVLHVFASAADGRRRKDWLGGVCFQQDVLLSARAALNSPL